MTEHIDRKSDLESDIQETYLIIREYETTLRDSNDAMERSRASRKARDGWKRLLDKLPEYFALCREMGYDIAEKYVQLHTSARRNTEGDLLPEIGKETRRLLPLGNIPVLPYHLPSSVVAEWLRKFSRDIGCNPFEATMAEEEDDAWRERHLVQHAVYRHLQDPGPAAVFADVGCGKTTCRLWFEKFLQERNTLAVDYSDWSALPMWGEAIPLAIHIQRIVERIARRFGQRWQYLDPFVDPCEAWVTNLVQFVKDQGYNGVCVLIDGVGNSILSREDPSIAAGRIEELINVTNPLFGLGLDCKFFLPSAIQGILHDSGRRAPGYRQFKLEWSAEQLREMLALRLNWGPPWWDGSLAGEFSLRVFLRDAVLSSDQVSEMLADTDRALIQKANRSPRRLFQLVSILFEQRAQKWADSGPSFDELHIQPDDLRYLLERLHLGGGAGESE